MMNAMPLNRILRQRQPGTSLYRWLKMVAHWGNNKRKALEFDLPPIKIPVKGMRYRFITIPPFDYSQLPRN